MATREPKTRAATTIEVVSRPGGRKGRLELTSGNIIYFRQGAQVETLRLTYQQFLSLLEREIEYRAIDARRLQLPKGHPEGDFRFEVHEFDEADDIQAVLSAVSSLRKLDPRRVDLGTYQFSHDMADGRKPKRRHWFAHVSIQATLWILNNYIDKFLLEKRATNYTDGDVVVSKNKMKEVLLAFLKKVDS